MDWKKIIQDRNVTKKCIKFQFLYITIDITFIIIAL